VTLGRALIEIGQLDEALPELELVLRSAPENLAAIRGIADIHHRQGSLGKALEFYKRALGLARNDPELEQTVADLTQLLTPTRRAEPEDGLSLEQMQREMTARMPPPAAVAAAAPVVLKPPARQTSPPQPPALQPSALQPSASQPPSLQLPVLHIPPARPDQAGLELGRDRAARTVAALEVWLEAIHVTRANRSS
jgi:tetratricopeptide (TPR) repeat protein